MCVLLWGFPGDSVVKNPANTGDTSLIAGLGRCPGEGAAGPFQYSCPGDPTARAAWWAPVPGVSEESAQLGD